MQVDFDGYGLFRVFHDIFVHRAGLRQTRNDSPNIKCTLEIYWIRVLGDLRWFGLKACAASSAGDHATFAMAGIDSGIIRPTNSARELGTPTEFVARRSQWTRLLIGLRTPTS